MSRVRSRAIFVLIIALALGIVGVVSLVRQANLGQPGQAGETEAPAAIPPSPSPRGPFDLSAKRLTEAIVLIDTSGSMRDDGKLAQAKAAARAVIDQLPPNVHIGLVRFADDVETLVPLGPVASNRGKLRAALDVLDAHGNSALNNALVSSVEDLRSTATDDPSQLGIIVLISDGQDTASAKTPSDVSRLLSQARSGRLPVRVIPVAIGSDANMSALAFIARASGTTLHRGDPDSLNGLLDGLGA